MPSSPSSVFQTQRSLRKCPFTLSVKNRVHRHRAFHLTNGSFYSIVRKSTKCSTANLHEANLIARIKEPYNYKAKLAESLTSMAPTIGNTVKIHSGYDNIIDEMTRAREIYRRWWRSCRNATQLWPQLSKSFWWIPICTDDDRKINTSARNLV